MVRASAHLGYNIKGAQTETVNRLMSQLIIDITTITELYPLEPGQSAEGLMIHLDASVKNFVRVGDDAIRDCPFAQEGAVHNLRDALEDVICTGEEMARVGRDFIRDSSSSKKRANATAAGQGLLKSIAHLLTIADMLDVSLLMECIDRIAAQLEDIKRADKNSEVEQRYSVMMAQIEELEETIKRRIVDLRDPQQRDDLLAARALLKSSCPMVLTTNRAFVRHPDREEAKNNRDFANLQVLRALDAMKSILSGAGSPIDLSLAVSSDKSKRLDNLATMLDDFQTKMYMEPRTYRHDVHRPTLEKLIEEIAGRTGKISDAESTRKTRHDAIADGCNYVRQALQDLLGEYESSCGRPSDDVDLAQVQVEKKTKDLRRHLRRAVVDNVSDAFLDISTPLLALIATAETGDAERTRLVADDFDRYAKKLISVSHLACDMSTDVEGIQIIKHTARQLEALVPEVIDAAMLLCNQGKSEVARQNMEVFKAAWESKVRLLAMAVDSLMTLDDFLAVTEAHIIEDALDISRAVLDSDYDILDRSAGAIRGRSLRVCSVVDTEMDALAPGMYKERVKQATLVLRDRHLEEFSMKASGVLGSVEQAAHAKRQGQPKDEAQQERDYEEMVDACTLIHDAVKQIRNALIVNRNPEDIDSDNEYEEDGQTIHDTASKVSEGDNQQRVMRRLPEAEKKKIQEHIDVFKVTQTQFEREVAKWDESGNDIIVLAKHMCTIMLSMTDFTRGCGPLKTTMDVINAAQDISVAGAKLKILAEQISKESADSPTKNELDSQLAKIPTYCQQLNICSKVKADVQQVGDNLVVSGLESATTLIQTAKNLLSAVVQTVKAAYITSTMIRKHNSSSQAARLEWRMAPPQKQPLVRPQAPEKRTAVIRRASERRPMRPAQALAQFIH